MIHSTPRMALCFALLASNPAASSEGGIAASTRIFEAEDGAFSGSVDLHSCWKNVMLTDAQHSTHSGTAAVDTKNEIGAFVEVDYEAVFTGPHRITARYTHIKPDPRPGELRVNGVPAATLTMPQSAALPAWTNDSVVVHLAAGKNTLRLSALKDGGLPNMDYIKVAEVRDAPKGSLPRIQVLEVEAFRYSGVLDDHSCWEFVALRPGEHSGPTGTGFVDTRNEPGSYVEVVVNVEIAGPHTVGIRYVHNKPDDRSATVSLNGAVVTSSLAFPQTGGWTVWRTVSTRLQLGAGRQVIRLTALKAEGLANIDHFELSRSDPSPQ